MAPHAWLPVSIVGRASNASPMSMHTQHLHGQLVALDSVKVISLLCRSSDGLQLPGSHDKFVAAPADIPKPARQLMNSLDCLKESLTAGCET